jgi:hypothetical protein
LDSSSVAPEIDGVGNIGDTVVTLTKLVWYRVSNLTTGSLGPVIFSPTYSNLHFRFISPARAVQVNEAIVKYDTGSSPDPDVKIDIREAGVSSCASGVREREGVVVYLKMPHSIGRRVRTVAIKASRIH